MGIRTVAVYSEPDRIAPHVLYCDEAYPLHGSTSTETYLNAEKILTIAKHAQVDAIHPGYGFLSEKSSFAKAVSDAGLIYIGPSFETIELLGNKTSARNLLSKNNIPIVPGTIQPIKDVGEAVQVASMIGYPILIKAAGGGGGKGMRRVDSTEELSNAFDRARNEALKAFSDDRIYIEKFIENPKHIEIQILGDSFGSIIHLGERECSIQRRHQKVIEECPSIAVDPELRSKIGHTAVAIARATQYVNAGTVEFLLDTNRNFYFLEVNTRIQVEHPVTEMVYGIDIVKEQICIAGGERLSITQKDVIARGHAIESRIYAEESDNNFLPSTGKILQYRPSEGPGIRNDSGVQSGSEISMHYDPMIAKLITHGNSREEAIARMRRALKEYRINGVKTTIPFCRFVMGHSEFINGTYDINFVQKYYQNPEVDLDQIECDAIAVSFSAERNLPTSHNNNQRVLKPQSNWKRRSDDE